MRQVAPRPTLPPAELPYAHAARPFAGRLLLASPFGLALLGAVLLGLGAVAAGAAVLVVGLLLVLIGWRLGSPARLVAALGARPADAERDARYVNVVEGLCVAHGLTTPDMRVLDDPAPNAVMLGNEERAYLVVTSGALSSLDRMELEGLVAHELAHLKRGDTKSLTLALRLLGPVALVTGGSGRLLRSVGDPTREFAADQLGAAMTRYPPGLRRALEQLGAADSRHPAAAGQGLLRLTAPFWCAPFDESPDRPVVAGVLDLSLRVDALAEL